MKFLLRLCGILLVTGTIYLWIVTIRGAQFQDANSLQRAGDKVSARQPLITFDLFIHAQQLRKMKLQDFCRKFPKFRAVNASDRWDLLFSSMIVSPKLSMVHCMSPGFAINLWEELIQALEKGADAGTWRVLPDDHPSETLHRRLSDYDLTMVKHVLRTYTKVLFVRDPFERLVSMYMRDHAGEITFDEFIENALVMETGEGGVSASSVISFCHPCLIRYDYIVMYDYLRPELYHLVNRIFSPQVIQLLGPTDTKSKSPPKWLIENLFRGLSEPQKNQLYEIYSQDFAAFPLLSSLIWNYTGQSR